METKWNNIIYKTKDFFRRAGFKKAVIGLSGGIDSAMVACIAVDALGKENVTCLMMPSRYSSEGSMTDSIKLQEIWGFNIMKISIKKLMVAYELYLGDQINISGITEENIQARIRANILMAYSNSNDALVLNTCNLSEDMVGYCTLYGDSIGAIAPLGNVYKTEVYALAKWVSSNVKKIPQEILNKPPSAELSYDQLDTDSLPDYKILDLILQAQDAGVLNKDIELRFGEDGTKVLDLIKKSEFKRKQSAPALEI